MTAKQKINFAKKEKNIEFMIEAYNQYYQEQKEKPSYQRISEIEKLPERLQKVVLANILKRKLLGLDRQGANEIIKHFLKGDRKGYCKYWWGKYKAKELLNEVVL